jgi:hypothetical protein
MNYYEYFIITIYTVHVDSTEIYYIIEQKKLFTFFEKL